MPGASADSLQQYLKLLTEAFKRSMTLADSLQEVVGTAANVADLASAAFSEALADYPALDLQWLGLLHQSRPTIVSALCRNCRLQYECALYNVLVSAACSKAPADYPTFVAAIACTAATEPALSLGVTCEA